MNEIEVKVLNIDSNKIKEKLETLGAKLVKNEFQINYMFDFSDKRFFDKGGYVRIRKLVDLIDKTEKIILTSKELISKDKFKISKEIEFEANNFKLSKDFLESLGLVLRRTDEKIRYSYELEEGLIEIDTWAGVPTYLEAEANSEENVIKLLEKIGYTLDQSTSMSLSEIMKYYNIKDDNRMFSEQDKKNLGF